ncbi:MAG: CDP-glucose 4,6-dehydratase [Mycoplasma sp.]
MKKIESFFKGKKILVTGHTGFKGAWLTKILDNFDVEIFCISKDIENDSIYNQLKFKKIIKEYFFDIADFTKFNNVISDIQPDLIFHLAAQSLVINSYQNPFVNYYSNVVGTINLCESISKITDKKVSVINVTTDKVYKNIEKMYKYKENDEINGFDPYSNSKSCADLISQCYVNNIFKDNIIWSNVRSGNVIGGGDHCENRIVPDIYRSLNSGEPLLIRSKNSIRPYQHVLESLFSYILISMRQYEESLISGNYNIAPDDESIITNEELLIKFQKLNPQLEIIFSENRIFHEAKLLLLDNSKMKQTFQWKPQLNIAQAIALTDEWEKSPNKDEITQIQILEYMEIFFNEK